MVDTRSFASSPVFARAASLVLRLGLVARGLTRPSAMADPRQRPAQPGGFGLLVGDSRPDAR